MNTPTEAAALLCPLARTFAASPAVEGCRGPACAAWRWETVTTAHPLWREAVRAEAEKTGEKVPFAKAARLVADNAVEFGLVPTKGFCGLAGLP
jgi:hypothetical protein